MIDTSSVDSEDYPLDPLVIQALWFMEDHHFWHSARNAWILRALAHHGASPPMSVLEVGCGGGAVARALHSSGYAVTGVDTVPALIQKAKDRSPSARFFAGDVGLLPRELQGPYDIIGFFDVLEHVAAPERLLEKALRWSKKDTLTIVTVPALAELHSVVDDLSCHKRRYEVGEAKALLERVGLRDVVEHGFFRVMVPLLKSFRSRLTHLSLEELDEDARRRIMQENFAVPSGPINHSMKVLCALERVLGFGLSVDKPGASLLAQGWRR